VHWAIHGLANNGLGSGWKMSCVCAGLGCAEVAMVCSFHVLSWVFPCWGMVSSGKGSTQHGLSWELGGLNMVGWAYSVPRTCCFGRRWAEHGLDCVWYYLCCSWFICPWGGLGYIVVCIPDHTMARYRRPSRTIIMAR
jgi:hypothetical protein